MQIPRIQAGYAVGFCMLLLRSYAVIPMGYASFIVGNWDTSSIPGCCLDLRDLLIVIGGELSSPLTAAGYGRYADPRTLSALPAC